MDKTATLLLPLSLLIVALGFYLIWAGLKPPSHEPLSPTQPPIALVTPAPAVLGEENEEYLVTEVVDGDTIKVMRDNQIYTIRLLGVDTPETKDPRKPVECFGKEASSETKGLIEGKAVILEKDVSDTDFYKRYLRHIFLPLPGDQGLLHINDYLIRQGFARPLTIPPDVEYSEQFLEAGRDARVNKRGLWGRC